MTDATITRPPYTPPEFRPDRAASFDDQRFALAAHWRICADGFRRDAEYHRGVADFLERVIAINEQAILALETPKP